MWQVLLLLYEQLHLMVGLISSSTPNVVLMAVPVHGSPLIFHIGVAFTFHLWNIVFNALTAITLRRVVL